MSSYRKKDGSFDSVVGNYGAGGHHIGGHYAGAGGGIGRAGGGSGGHHTGGDGGAGASISPSGKSGTTTFTWLTGDGVKLGKDLTYMVLDESSNFDRDWYRNDQFRQLGSPVTKDESAFKARVASETQQQKTIVDLRARLTEKERKISHLNEQLVKAIQQLSEMDIEMLKMVAKMAKLKAENEDLKAMKFPETGSWGD